jgi:predicted ATPase/DNA-binding SARP family transcriptional activator
MRFGILGPLEATDDHGRKLALGGPKQRAVLAILLLHANEVVSTDRLIDLLWGERAPRTATKTIQVYVSMLRKALGDELLSSRGQGYVLRTEDAEVDAERFGVLVGDGRRALEQGDAGAAVEALGEALSLWRGPPLAEFAYEPFAQGEIARLEEARMAALEERTDAELALGGAAGLVGELRALVREQPLRERLRGQLMLALYRAGRQADALAVYRETSEVLRDELGLEPSRPLQELELAMLRQDPALQRVDHEQIAAPGGNLPVPSTPFVGRAHEFAEITALLHAPDTRLVTLTGAGGSGKTRLALRVAEGSAADYRDGAWFVGFADVADPELIVPAICQTLGVAEQPGLPPVRALSGWLGQRALLLVLDNLEQLASGTAVLGELLATCPRVRMLATSREPLRLAGEQQYEVPVLDPEDAIELFTARARTVAPSVIIERERAAAVCERLDRLPLAIELAAARSKVLSPALILARLESHLPVLASGPRDAPRRQRTLQATIDWSYELLTEEEQQLLARLSVFAGGCTLDGAEAVCDARLDVLEGLVDRSLLRSGGGRYWMLQTLREYALDKLARSGEEDDIRHRHARWYVELLASHGLDKSADVDTGRLRMLLQEERENFRAALERGEQAGEVETVARLAAPLTRLWRDEGSLSEADRWIAVARARSSEYPLSLQALVLSAACGLAWAHGAHQEWADLCEQALAAYRELGDVAGIIRGTDMRAVAAAELGDLSGGRAMMEEAVQLAREHEDTGWLPNVLSNLADLEIAAGRLDQARVHCEEALASHAKASSPTNVVEILQLNLAYIANIERRHADAAELAQDALSGALAVGFLRAAAAAATCLAWSLAELEQPEQAARLLGAATQFFEHTGTAMQWSDTAAEQAARDALNAQLDRPAMQALLDEGRAMTIEQAALIPGGLSATRERLTRDAEGLRSV